MADVEMKSADKPEEEKKEEEQKAQEPDDHFYELKKSLVILEKAGKEKDFKTCAPLTKQFKKLRKLYNLSDFVLVLKFYLPDLYQRLQLPCQPAPLQSGESVEDKLHCTAARAAEISQVAECQIFLYVILLMKLIDDGDLRNAKEFGDFVLARIRGVNQRTIDSFAAKAIYFVSIAYEKLGQLTQLRPLIFEAYKDCCLYQNQIGQATTMNIIIRTYLNQNLYEQARNFITKTTFPENVSNNQYARYLYYQGRIKAVQLEYSEAQASLIQAIRKAPEVGAVGFRIHAHKLLIIVMLLMGEIPQRQVFDQKEFQKYLQPYYLIVQYVKQGEMDKFNALVARYQRMFAADKILSLIGRLKHTVIKFGLKKINISYSKISLADIASKLNLESVEETEQIVSKAIRDGVIDATINHDEQFIQSLNKNDVYTSNEPQNILHKRIRFCMETRNDAVKALVYPQKEDKRDFGDDVDQERDNKEEDLLAALMEEMGGMDDF